MFAFTYHKPGDTGLAVELASRNPDAKFLAGGQTLIPTLKQRLAAPSDLVDLGALGDLRGISVCDEGVLVGAMTPHEAVASSPLMKAHIPALADLAGLIGDPAVRQLGTLGGSVANSDPSADYPAACLALGATVITDRRRIAAADFFLGLFETALEPSELITAIVFPAPQGAAYTKFRNPASRYAMAGVFIVRGTEDVRVAVTGVSGDGVFRWQEAEAALATDFSEAALGDIVLPAEGMISDMHGTGAYRAHLASVMARLAVRRMGVSPWPEQPL
ncbi:xanthine dehydrogenase family protein subunit M [Terrihabitans rhizophilus]|uniref:Xanthine dehydrogenase family protein subunit M n=1 Tax=Terrihabitans rhizophilus TaxID=3092662 RepID=A0ABU4RN38_9HYPH|nr:xanthine dehydrogenase family protein subunit M [Terrihabitans sp. PJ23]MDX6806234.1 xanthine dehydrogenase family protein subunit M [Terrihabitans sp. PJ23]